MSIATAFNYSRTLGVPGPTGPAGPLGFYGNFTSYASVANNTTANVQTDDLAPYFYCTPSTSAGCHVLGNGSPRPLSTVTLKTGATTTATHYSVFDGNGYQVEQPLSPGTFASTAKLDQAGQSQTWTYLTGVGYVL